MKNQPLKILLGAGMALSSSLALGQGGESSEHPKFVKQDELDQTRANQLRKHWNEAELPKPRDWIDQVSQETAAKTRVRTSVYSLAQAIGGNKKSVDGLHLLTGFSGADYQNKAQAIKLMLSIIESRLIQAGGQTQAFILGQTNDGFGEGLYNGLNDRRQNRNSDGKKIIIAGIGSNEAIKYEMEYGKTINPNNDFILSLPTFLEFEKIANGKPKYAQSWESKLHPDLRSANTQIFIDTQWETASINVFGGAEIAYKEVVEALAIARILEGRGYKGKILLNIVVGFEPGKPAKDKGPRASEMLALLLVNTPALVSDNVEVSIYDASKTKDASLESTPRYTLGAFRSTAAYQKIETEFKNAAQLIVVEEAKLPALKAQADQTVPPFNAVQESFKAMKKKLKDAGGGTDEEKLELAALEAKMVALQGPADRDTLALNTVEARIRNLQALRDKTFSLASAVYSDEMNRQWKYSQSLPATDHTEATAANEQRIANELFGISKQIVTPSFSSISGGGEESCDRPLIR